MAILLILIVSFAFTKAMFNDQANRHRERMEYAKQGKPSPADDRRIAKQNAKTAGGATPDGEATTAGGATTGSGSDAGLLDYSKTLWVDLWDDAKKRHERERAKKRPDGGRTLPAVAVGWWNWIVNPKGENDSDKPRPGDEVPAPVLVSDPEPTGGPEPDPAAPIPNPLTPVDPDIRYCPECPARLIEHPDGWFHPGRQPCPADGRTAPYQGPKPAAPVITGGSSSGSSTPVPAVAANGSGSPPPAPGRPLDGYVKPRGVCPPCLRDVYAIGNGRLVHPDGSALCGDPGGTRRPKPAGAHPCDTCGLEINEFNVHFDGMGHPAPCPGPGFTQRCDGCGETLVGLSNYNHLCPRKVQQCNRCDEVLVGISIIGHVCPKAPQATEQDTRAFGRPGSDEQLAWEREMKNLMAQPSDDLPVTQETESSTTAAVTNAAGANGTTHNASTTNNGGSTMALEFNYDAIVQAHKDLMADLNLRLEQAMTVKNHAEQAAAAADGMDTGRSNLIAKATDLMEGMQEAKFDVNSIAGCAEAAEAFSAQDAAAIEENCQEVVAKAVEIIRVTEGALASVSQSLSWIIATYGALAEGVQSTGVRGAALEGV